MKLFSKSILVAFLGIGLVACGGGSDNNSNSNNDSNTNSNNGSNTNNNSTGSIVEKLDTSKAYRIIYSFPESSGSSNITAVKQNDIGIITEFGAYKLSGTIIGKEISGNKNYAIARIAGGNIDYAADGKTQTTDVSKYANGSYYYFVSSLLTQKLESSSIKRVNCTDINATQAKITNDKSNNYFVSPTIHNGSVTLNPDGAIGISFTAKIGSDETSYNSSMNWVENFNAYNSFNLLGIENQQGQSSNIGTFNISNNGKNSVVAGSIYKIKLKDGSIYEGAMSMICNY